MYKQHLHLQIAKMLFVQAAGALKVLGAEALPPFLRDGGLGQERLGVGGEDMAGDLKQAIRVAEDASGIALHRADGSHFPKIAAKQKTSPSCFVRQLSSQEEPW